VRFSQTALGAQANRGDEEPGAALWRLSKAAERRRVESKFGNDRERRKILST
jgi:hypothetical protein